MTNRPYLRLIQQSVIHDGIVFEEITPDFVYRARRGNESFVMFDTQVGLNNSASTDIARSKAVAYDVLRRAGIPAVEHVFLSHPNARFSQSDPYGLARTAFNRFGHKAVVKPDDGSQGRHVYKVENVMQLEGELDLLFSLEYDASISPFYEAETEYRVVTLKEKAHIFLAKERTTSWKHNLVSGAISKTVATEQQSELADIAVRATRALGLSFCSVDILHTNKGLLVIEINDKVMLDEYCKDDSSRNGAVSELYRQALLLRFERNGHSLTTDV